MTAFQFFRISFEFWAIIFGVIAAICVFATRSYDRKAALTLVWMLATDIVMNIADILLLASVEYRFFDNWLIPHTLLLIVYLCTFLFILFSAQHIAQVVSMHGGQESRRLTSAATIIAVIGMAVLIAAQIFTFIYTFDEKNGFIRLDTYYILIVLEELSLLPIIIQIIRCRCVLPKSEFTVLLCSHLLIAAGYFIQLMFENHPCFHLSYAFALIVIVLTYQIGFAKDSIEWEQTLVRMRVHLYTRQIQPHFIYNSLSAIRSKLPEDSEARESLNHFAGFMRGSIDLLTAESCIPASREFATVRDYLYMEQERFGDALTVVTDLQDEDFELPPFTVQTLVENAIRYGIRENLDGRGTLTIKSCRTARTHVIEVIDDGAGFDPSELTAGKDEHAHIGLLNIRKRLEIMCKGTLSIDSAPGKGTQAKVEIPIKRGNDQ